MQKGSAGLASLAVHASAYVRVFSFSAHGRDRQANRTASLSFCRVLNEAQKVREKQEQARLNCCLTERRNRHICREGVAWRWR